MRTEFVHLRGTRDRTRGIPPDIVIRPWRDCTRTPRGDTGFHTSGDGYPRPVLESCRGRGPSRSRPGPVLPRDSPTNPKTQSPMEGSGRGHREGSQDRGRVPGLGLGLWLVVSGRVTGSRVGVVETEEGYLRGEGSGTRGGTFEGLPVYELCLVPITQTHPPLLWG